MEEEKGTPLHPVELPPEIFVCKIIIDCELTAPTIGSLLRVNKRYREVIDDEVTRKRICKGLGPTAKSSFSMLITAKSLASYVLLCPKPSILWIKFEKSVGDSEAFESPIQVMIITTDENSANLHFEAIGSFSDDGQYFNSDMVSYKCEPSLAPYRRSQPMNPQVKEELREMFQSWLDFGARFGTALVPPASADYKKSDPSYCWTLAKIKTKRTLTAPIWFHAVEEDIWEIDENYELLDESYIYHPWFADAATHE